MKNSINECIFLVFLLYSLSILAIHRADDVINTTQIIRDGETMVSSAGRFELGFFSPGSSANRYVGVWLANITVRTPIWVANRESPVRNSSSAILRITPSGQVVIQDGTGNTSIWSSNISRVAQNPVLKLLDSGNLVVREANDDNPLDVLWQSFDSPTNTILQGWDMGWNFVTGIDRYVSSWISDSDPARGDYTCSLDITGYPQVVIRRGNITQNRLGPWNGIRFSGVPPVRNNPTFTGNVYLNSTVAYYREDAIDKSVISRFSLNPSGVGQRLTWADRNQDWVVYYNLPSVMCDSYRLCGAYGCCHTANAPVCQCLDRFIPSNIYAWDGEADWSGGCVRRTPLNCPTDVFLSYTGIKLPDSQFTWYNQSMNIDECRAVCLGNCSCTAYSNLDVRNGGSGCLVWFGDLVDMKLLPEENQAIYIRMAASEADTSGNRRMVIAILTSLAGVVLLVLSILLFIWKRKKYHRKLPNEGEPEGTHDEDMELPVLDLSTITKATNCFSEGNKLGEGGYGPVYKGKLEDGKEIAVKRLSRTSLQGLDEFKNEVICIAKLQHRNLVKLLGCCIEAHEKMLIYEYMPNKSLNLILFDTTKSKQLDWRKRFDIINGITRGLLYLHQDSRLRIIHRDLKASNILLDADMIPKISDFGMARSFGGNETEANTNRVVGTYGYMSPEYAVDGLFSIKSDVYSFGVLVLEIVSGKKNRGFHHEDHQHNLLGHAWILYREGRSFELVDQHLFDSMYITEMQRAIHVALLCVQQSPEDRPNMSAVILMLGSEGVLPRAKQPGFFTERDVFGADTTSSSEAAISSNECSITLLDPR